MTKLSQQKVKGIPIEFYQPSWIGSINKINQVDDALSGIGTNSVLEGLFKNICIQQDLVIAETNGDSFHIAL